MRAEPLIELALILPILFFLGILLELATLAGTSVHKYVHRNGSSGWLWWIASGSCFRSIIIDRYVRRALKRMSATRVLVGFYIRLCLRLVSGPLGLIKYV